MPSHLHTFERKQFARTLFQMKTLQITISPRACIVYLVCEWWDKLIFALLFRRVCVCVCASEIDLNWWSSAGKKSGPKNIYASTVSYWWEKLISIRIRMNFNLTQMKNGNWLTNPKIYLWRLNFVTLLLSLPLSLSLGECAVHVLIWLYVHCAWREQNILIECHLKGKKLHFPPFYDT